MSSIRRLLVSKEGSQMVEAAIVIPIIIIGIILLLRLFTFYLEILNTGIKEHEKALEKWDTNKSKLVEIYENTENVEMLKGGLLGINLEKKIYTKAYYFNEDVLVRARMVLDEE